MRCLWIATALSLVLTISPALSQSYGFLRTVEGPAELLQGRSQTSVEATTNYPIQMGDQMRVGPNSRLEAVLPDSSVLRLGANTELRFGRIADSLDSSYTDNLLHLIQGNVQITVADGLADSTGFRVDTANSTVELLAAGGYRIFSDGKSWTQVIVREGLAEVITERNSKRVSAGQQVVIDGDRSPRMLAEAAPPIDSLESWGARLDEAARGSFERNYVAPRLSYAATPLYRHGTWYQDRGAAVWRPHVSAEWRPYLSGWWIYTPSGLTWISTEPWGWVTYHYGNWYDAPGHGWVWQPGHAYTPGSVRWYWGPTHVGWYPLTLGYPNPYHAYYAFPPYGYSMSWNRFNDHRYRLPYGWRDWTYCAYRRFGYRDSHRYLQTGAELANQGLIDSAVPRGILTTDTRALTPNLWDEPQRVLGTLQSHAISGPRSSDRVRSANRRQRQLSPLGTAALQSSSSSRSRELPPTASSLSVTSRPVRQWDPTLWRRQNLARPQSVSLYGREARSQARSSRSQTRGSGRLGWHGSEIARPTTPGRTGRSVGTRTRSAPPGSQRVGSGASSQLRGNRPSRPPAAGRPGGMSGSDRSPRGSAGRGPGGRGGARGSMSGDRGSG